MTSDAHATISCESCGRRYAWKAELAGKRVKCKCGGTFVVPQVAPGEQAAPVEPPEQDLYDIAPEPQTPRPLLVQVAPLETVEPAQVPLMSQPVNPAAVRSLEYQRGDLGGSKLERYFPDRVKDLWMPLALIAGGTFIELALGFFGRRGGVSGAATAVVAVGVWMIVNTILMLIAIFIVAKLREISFGPLPTAILKLCGISIGPGAIGALVGVALGWLPLSGLIGWLVGFVLYFALIGALFDLDESDTWWCVGTIFFVKVLVAIVVMRLLI